MKNTQLSHKSLWIAACLCTLVLIPGCAAPSMSLYIGVVAASVIPILLLLIAILRLYSIVPSFIVQTIIYFLSLLSTIIGLAYVEYDCDQDNIFRAALYRSVVAAALFTLSLLLGCAITAVQVPFGHWGAFAFAYLFLLLLGDLYVRATAQDIESSLDREHSPSAIRWGLASIVRKFRSYQELQYLIFPAAPAISLILWWFEILTTSLWLQHFFIVVFSLMMVSIFISIAFLSARLAQPIDMVSCDQLKQCDAESLYKLSSDIRTLIFTDMFHSLVVAAVYLTGAYLCLNPGGRVEISRQLAIGVATIFTTMATVFLFLPYYIGQTLSVRAIRRAVDRSDLTMPFHEFEDHLYKVAAPYPSGANIKFMLLSLTAGGVLTALVGKALGAIIK